jgi:hypothetical protein
MKIMPNKLTDENVADITVSEVVKIDCPICTDGIDPFGDKCDHCKGLGSSMRTVVMSADNIKSLYDTLVEKLGEPTKPIANTPTKPIADIVTKEATKTTKVAKCIDCGKEIKIAIRARRETAKCLKCKK